MKEVIVNNQMKLSQNFSLGELTKTSHKTADGNIPSRVITCCIVWSLGRITNRRRILFIAK